jgi:hypothetical protein
VSIIFLLKEFHFLPVFTFKIDISGAFGTGHTWYLGINQNLNLFKSVKMGCAILQKWADIIARKRKRSAKMKIMGKFRIK